MTHILKLILICIIFQGCAYFEAASVPYDNKPFLVQSMSLFNQRKPSSFSKQSWKGDWIFRRERLDLIDKNFRNFKPDILIVQESLSKMENASESDRSIFLSSSLIGYDWYLRVIREFEDTQEIESMATAVGLPLKIDRAKILSGREFWDVGLGGFMVVSTIEFEGQYFTVFNLQMPETGSALDLWYEYVRERIKEKISELQSCNRRIILAGFMNAHSDSQFYNQLMNEFELKDTSLGFCEQENSCVTATPANDLFLATKGDARAARVDRILVHNSAIVYSSSPVVVVPETATYAHQYGLNKIWPQQRYGWATTVKFARCP